MNAHSILFRNIKDSVQEKTLEVPALFPDLNLDQVIDSMTGSRQEYNLKLFFYTPLRDVDDILYRHEIMQDLENGLVFGGCRGLL